MSELDRDAEIARLRADVERMRDALATVRCRLKLAKAYGGKLSSESIDDLLTEIARGFVT